MARGSLRIGEALARSGVTHEKAEWNVLVALIQTGQVAQM